MLSTVKFQSVGLPFRTLKTFSRTFSSSDEFKVIVVGGGHAGKKEHHLKFDLFVSLGVSICLDMVSILTLLKVDLDRRENLNRF